MKRPLETVKTKVLLGYFFLIGIAAFSVWFIYSESLLISDSKNRVQNLNNKILFFNSVLTNLYQAESLERTYIQTGNTIHFVNYERLMKEIYQQIDSLSVFTGNPKEQIHTDSILHLLDQKRKNLNELMIYKKISSSDDLFKKALEKFSLNRDSINVLLQTNKTVSESMDTSYILQKKKNFFQRLASAFSSQKHDSLLKIKTQKIIKNDTIFQAFNPADTIMQFLNAVMLDIQKETQLSERELAGKEMNVLAIDRILTSQLRKMLSIFEKDIFRSSLEELQLMQARIKQSTSYLIIVGLIAFIVIVIFVVLILKDISQSQRYRHELEKAKTYSDSLLKSKEQLILNITHDIKTPIASITGFAEMMKNSNSKEQKEHFFENINKSATDILSLINDLIDLNRLETGKLKINKARFNFVTWINEIFYAFYPLALSKKISFSLENNISSDVFYVSDHIRIKQIIGNIISNAIKYTDSGSVIVNVSLVESENNIDQVQFEVADTGIGISDDDIGIIFNEFSRGNFQKGNYEGSGLGLAIVQKLISLFNGKIKVQSNLGKGSRFIVQLPFERSVERNDIILSEKEPVVTFNSNISKNILLIDDDEVFLELIHETIKKTGLNVHACKSLTKAISIMDKVNIDLIITDVNLPKTSGGFNMISYIQRKTGRVIPLIAMSGIDYISAKDLPGLNVSCFLKKPFLSYELISQINRILKINVNHINKGETEKFLTLNTDQKDTKYRYNLDPIRNFTMNDPKSFKQILTSFIESTYENMITLNEIIMSKNRILLSELSHKMLTMFRQLEAEEIIIDLMAMENAKESTITDEQLIEKGKTLLMKIDQLLDLICEEQNLYTKTH